MITKLLHYLFPPKKSLSKKLWPDPIKLVTSYNYFNGKFKVRFSLDVADTIYTVEPNADLHIDDFELYFMSHLAAAYPDGFIVTFNKITYTIKLDGKIPVDTKLIYTTGPHIRIK
jgi:hypothetical protein